MAKKNADRKPAAAPASKAPAPAVSPPAAAAATPASAAVARAPAAPAPAEAPGSDIAAAPVRAHGFRRTLVGKITSDKMDKTVTVEVIRNTLDPVYKKYVRQRQRYKAHDEQNQFKVGDRVEITEHRPISRDKRWLVTKLVTRRVEE